MNSEYWGGKGVKSLGGCKIRGGSFLYMGDEGRNEISRDNTHECEEFVAAQKYKQIACEKGLYVLHPGSG